MFSIAVIGYGYWGEKLTSKWAAIENAQLRHVCDINPVRAQIAKGIYQWIDTSTDYQELLADATIQAVNIATPIETHFEITRDALNAGKHVLVEKPLSCSGAEVDALIRIADDNDLILMAGHTFLFSPPVLKAKEIIEAGELGKIEAVFMKRNNLGRHKMTNNVLWDLAPHDLSILDCWLDEQPVAVQTAGVCSTTPGVCDIAVMTLHYPSGAIANVQLSWKSPLKERYALVIGSKKMLTYDDNLGVEAITLYDTGVEVQPNAPQESAFHYRVGDIHVPHISQKEPLMSECVHFMECVEKHQAPFPHSIHARRVVHIIEKAQQSLDQAGARIEL
ncbi:MAG: Gfo/Idh/MocA family oxidoreductase [Candidatus Cloacimonetes bacterium]|nr:Gfo/Idh/MocA family oxidoreductase [Candidatus Cloacimonadota bacterium]